MILFINWGQNMHFHTFSIIFSPNMLFGHIFAPPPPPGGGKKKKKKTPVKFFSLGEGWMQCRWTNHFGYHNSHNLAIQKIGPNPRPNAKKSCVEWILYTLSSLIFCLKSNFNLLMREIFLFLGQVFRSCQPPSSCRPPWSPRTDAQNSHVLVLGIIRQGQFCINP